jgi:hypothetical protein
MASMAFVPELKFGNSGLGAYAVIFATARAEATSFRFMFFRIR